MATSIVWCCHICVLGLILFPHVHSLKDITSKVFDVNPNGILAAFGDFNADKLTDVFLITEGETTLQLFLASEEEPLLVKSSIKCFFGNKVVLTSVVPGDFDGDSQMDVLVTFHDKTQEATNYNTRFTILWGNLHNLDCNGKHYSMYGQPLVMDYNADKIPDLYGESEKGNRQVWIMGTNKTHTVLNVSKSECEIRHPHSNAFLDFTGDMAADLIVTVLNKTENKFEVWHNKDGEYIFLKAIKFPTDVASIGQSVFLDIDLDGDLDHLVPVCNDKACLNSSIRLYRNEMWVTISSTFEYKNEIWSFCTDTNNPLQLPITLRGGDINLDGHPDLVTVMCNLKSKKRQAFVLENQPCVDCSFGRQYSITINIASDSINLQPMIVAMYDVYQDGNLDFIVVGKDDKDNWKTIAIQNEITADVSFIKILVLSGLCYIHCPNGRKPYGVNQPGPFVRYRTVRPDGTPQQSCAAQLPQSAHFALHLPYTVFGLGQTPNFVDDLVVGVPVSTKKENHIHEWPSIIPNSQMIVIPLQDDNGDYRWLNKLFVTPSHQVLLTFIALVSFCAFLVIIIGGLHWKEKLSLDNSKDHLFLS